MYSISVTEFRDYEVQENDVKMKKAISSETLFEDFVEKSRLQSMQ